MELLTGTGLAVAAGLNAYIPLLILGLAGRFQQYDRACWAEMGEAFAEAFATRTRDDWAALLEGKDACVTAVLSLAEAPLHPHNVTRGMFLSVGGAVQPAPAPRFSGSPSEALPPQSETAAARKAVRPEFLFPESPFIAAP